MEELRIETRLRNNRLYTAIFSNFKSVKHFCESYGLNGGQVGSYLNLTESPILKDGSYSLLAKKVCVIFSSLEEDLFPREIYKIKKTSAHIELSYSNYVIAICPEQRMIDTIENKQLGEALNSLLCNLKDRDKMIIEHRYGLNGKEFKTLEELATILNRSKALIATRERISLNKMRLKGKKSLIEYVR